MQKLGTSLLASMGQLCRMLMMENSRVSEGNSPIKYLFPPDELR